MKTNKGRLSQIAFWSASQAALEKIIRKETTMKFKVRIASFALMLVAGILALTLSLSTGAASESASAARNGEIHLIKECSAYTGLAGSFCTITSSSLAAIPVGSKNFYDQAANIPAGLVDSNVVLDAGNGNRALGRCTVDRATLLALCTYSDGTGELAGFQARLNVSHMSGFNWALDGTYSFSPLPPR